MIATADTIVMSRSELDALIRDAALAAAAETAKRLAAPETPNIIPQDWRAVDGSVAWHLIERHAENWDHVATMMDKWRDANIPEDRQHAADLATAFQREACARICDDVGGESARECAKRIRAQNVSQR